MWSLSCTWTGYCLNANLAQNSHVSMWVYCSVVGETFRSGNWENKPLLLFPSFWHFGFKEVPLYSRNLQRQAMGKWGNCALTDPPWAKGPLKHFTHFRIALLPHFTKKWPTILWKCTSIHLKWANILIKKRKRKDARQILVRELHSLFL